MAAEPVFVDSNVLIYASRLGAPQRVAARAAIDRLQGADRPLWISPQVLREYLAVVTRPQATAPAQPMSVALADVRCLAASFNVTGEGPRILERLLSLLETHPGSGKQVHDANLVATMLEAGIRRMLTFNAGDFNRFDELIRLEPI